MKLKTITLGILALALSLCPLSLRAQRPTDKLDRGLVAVKTSNGVFTSWRIFGEEYYDVTYNLYRDGTKLNDKPLRVSNYVDGSGTTASQYTVRAIVRGVEQEPCAAVTPWERSYFEVPLQPVLSRSGADVTSEYVANDVSLGDLDGDGVCELLLKRINQTDADKGYPVSGSNYTMLEAYKLDGTRLWYIDVGPNMVSGSSVEINFVAYDWDGDGRAEVLLRGADNMIVHYRDGDGMKQQLIGSATYNSRGSVNHDDGNMAYTHEGAEYLIYLEGATGRPISTFRCRVAMPPTGATATDTVRRSTSSERPSWTVVTPAFSWHAASIPSITLLPLMSTLRHIS
jgi:hypothetical protein